MMKASYLGAMGYAQRYNFPTTWPIPPIYHDPATSVQSYQEGMEECEFAEEMGFAWVSFSEHHYSGRIATGTPAVMAAAVAERCKKVKIAEKYYHWCQEAGWRPTPEQIVYRGSIYLAETDKQAAAWLEGVKRAGPAPGGIAMRPSVSRAIQAARAGEEFDLRHILAGSVQGDVAGTARGLNFMGGPDTVAKQIKAFHDQCGVGVVDLFFQQPRVSHKEVMQEIELFGREVLPQMKEF